MVSVKSWAWFSVLNPAVRQRLNPFFAHLPGARTLIAVDKCILDNHRATIGSSELLCLAAGLPEASCVLDLVVGPHAARHAQHMAC